MVLICISWITNDSEHFSWVYLPSVVSALVNCLFRSSNPSSHWLFAFSLLRCQGSVCIVDISPMLDMWPTNICSPSVACLFVLLTVFYRAAVLKFEGPFINFFLLHFILLVSHLRTFCPSLAPEGFPFFFLKAYSFMFHTCCSLLWVNFYIKFNNLI